MKINLLNLLKDQLNDNIIGKTAGIINQSPSVVNSALGNILPTVLGSVVSKGSNKTGAESLLNIIKDGKHDGSIFDKLPNLLSDKASTSSLLNIGKFLLPLLMGSNQNSILRKITNLTGLTSSNSSSMMSLVAPIVMGMIGKQVSKNNLGVGGLMDLLKGQRSFLDSALPEGMGNLLGFADLSSESNKTSYEPVEENNGGGGWLKWLLLGLAALLILGYFGMRTGCSSVDDAAQTVSNTTTDVVSSAKETVKGIAGVTVDATGNLIDESGKVLSKAGEYTKDAAGNIVDKAGNIIRRAGDAVANTPEAISNAANKVETNAEKAITDATTTAVSEITYTVNATGDLIDEAGKVVYKAGDFTISDEGYYLDKQGNRIGRVLKKIGEAIGTAAEKTGEFFSNTFTKMFKKEAGASTTYLLSDITFNPESHRIIDFSKAEVEGLAAALKANPDAKIQVQAHTSDGSSGAENRTLSATRAKVVEDMLVTLGVNKKQISSEGMGNKDATKARNNKIEIQVE